MQVQTIENALTAARPIKSNERFFGCCRVYVTVSDSLTVDQIFSLTKQEKKQFKKNWRKNVGTPFAEAAQNVGMIYQSKGYGVTNALYIGYWNQSQDGIIDKAEGIKKALIEIGISARVEMIGD